MEKRSKECAVRRSDPWPVDSPLQDGQLVAQRQYLHVLVHVAHRQQPYKSEHAWHGEVGQSQQHDPSDTPTRRSPAVTRTCTSQDMDGVFGTRTSLDAAWSMTDGHAGLDTPPAANATEAALAVDQLLDPTDGVLVRLQEALLSIGVSSSGSACDLHCYTVRSVRQVSGTGMCATAVSRANPASVPRCSDRSRAG
jgi:hypothetical protein